MMTNDDERGEGGKKCPKFDDVIICERPHIKQFPVAERGRANILKTRKNKPKPPARRLKTCKLPVV